MSIRLKNFVKDGISAFKAKIEDIARQRLASDKKLRYLPPEAVYKELMQDMDRLAWEQCCSDYYFLQ
jgi:hypothetical protein